MDRHSRFVRGSVVVAVAAIAAGTTVAASDAEAHSRDPRGGERSFAHVGTFDVTRNGSEVAEIVTATRDGRTLLYTDSATGSVGFVDLADPADPVPAGTVPVGGEPTSVTVGTRYALVAVNTSPDFVNPDGSLLVLDPASRTVVATLALGGQPDSVALSPDGRYAAVVLENERDEDLNDGLLPQSPGGRLVIVRTTGAPSSWTTRTVDFTGLDMADSADPEPEFVDINDANLAVVTFQENNHLAVVDLRKARVVSDFPAGSVTLRNVDATEEELGPQGNGVISLTETITKRREPDGVAWLDSRRFATANEGDYTDADGVEGGSRGFTVFDVTGRVLSESASSFEHRAISAGHYPEGRSANKGIEPESIEFGVFGSRKLLFVGAERANVIGVYDVTTGTPSFVQLLPSGIGPEGLRAITSRNLLVAASETSVEGAVPSLITVYRYDRGAPAYPQLRSVNGRDGLPIPWVAMSGLAGHPHKADTLYGVSDSILAEAAIYTIDAGAVPAAIRTRTVVTDPDGAVRNDLDLEGVAAAPEGGFWVASEGRTNDGSSRPNLLVRLDAAGRVIQEVPLPAELLAAGLTSSGFEGVAVEGRRTTRYVYAVIQREWASDAAGSVKIGRYEPATGEWTFVSYALDAVASPAGGWVGLSEITALPDGRFAIVERDDRSGTDARVKRVYGVDLAKADFQPFVAGSPLPTVRKRLLVDLLDELTAASVWTPDKLEGLAVSARGTVYAVTDNDGLDDAVGQTVFLDLGNVKKAFRR